MPTLAINKRANFDYIILEKYEADLEYEKSRYSQQLCMGKSESK